MPFESSTGSSLSDRDIELASFWVRNKIVLRKIGYGILIAIGASLWLYAIWGLLDAYAISYPIESRIPLRIIQNQQAIARYTSQGPKQLKLGDILSFTSTDNRVDALIEMENSNSSWWAEFDYYFERGGVASTKKKGFILPRTQRFLAEPGMSGTGEPKLVIENLSWKRITLPEINGDLETFYEQREVQVENPRYTRDKQIESTVIGESSFTIKNPTAFGYIQPEYIVILYRSGTPAGVTRITDEILDPGATKSYTLTWVEAPAGITETIVYPVLNYLHPDQIPL